MSTKYTPVEEEILLELRSIRNMISSNDQKVSSLDQKVSSLEVTTKDGFKRVNERLDDFRDEFVGESASTRVLLHQAFTHISEQLTQEETTSFVPKYPRVKL